MWGNIRRNPLTDAEKAILSRDFDILDTEDFQLTVPMNKLEARLLVEEHHLTGVICDQAIHLSTFGNLTNVGFFVYKGGEPDYFILLSLEETHPFNKG